MMYDREKSDSAIVAGKPANKAVPTAAEPVEPRVEAKGNASQQSTRRTQSRGKRVTRAGAHTANRNGKTLCRHTPKVGAECPNGARSDLCGGRSVMSVPTAISEMSSQNIPLKGRTDFRGSYIRCSNLVRIAAISSLNFRRHFLSRARTSSVVGSSPDSMR